MILNGVITADACAISAIAELIAVSEVKLGECDVKVILNTVKQTEALTVNTCDNGVLLMTLRTAL